jgi:hypothetical protein
MIDFALIIEDNRQESNWMPALTIHKIHVVHRSLLLHRIILRTAFGPHAFIHKQERFLNQDFVLSLRARSRLTSIIFEISVANLSYCRVYPFVLNYSNVEAPNVVAIFTAYM